MSSQRKYAITDGKIHEISQCKLTYEDGLLCSTTYHNVVGELDDSYLGFASYLRNYENGVLVLEEYRDAAGNLCSGPYGYATRKTELIKTALAKSFRIRCHIMMEQMCFVATITQGLRYDKDSALVQRFEDPNTEHIIMALGYDGSVLSWE